LWTQAHARQKCRGLVSGAGSEVPQPGWCPARPIHRFIDNKEQKMSFEFTQDGRIYRVHTTTGAGLARVIVEEVNAHEAAPIEPSEETL
jgi:hypothetical protein